MAADLLNQFLVEQWDSMWDGQGWFASWVKALDDLTPMQASWTPDDERHSIWQIVHHVTFWQSVTLGRTEGKADPSAEETAQRNFEEPTAISEDAWNETKELLQDSHRAIRTIFAGDRPGLNKVQPHLTHDAYHLGQIMMLRAMQGLTAIV